MPHYCLIVLQTPLVAQDLALTLGDLTGCVPIHAEKLDDAFAALTGARTAPGLAPGALHCAFLQTDAAALRASPLCARLEDLGARVVLLGHAAEMEAARDGGRAQWPVLAQPFGPAQVAEVLEDAAPPVGRSPCEPRSGGTQGCAPAP